MRDTASIAVRCYNDDVGDLPYRIRKRDDAGTIDAVVVCNQNEQVRFLVVSS